MEVKQFDLVELKSGRRATILDIYNNPPGYEIEIEGIEDMDELKAVSIGVQADEVVRVIEPA